MDRSEMMNLLYSKKEKNEDSRLTRSRHGQLEYLTTMNYIHKFVPPVPAPTSRTFDSGGTNLWI